MTEPARFDAIRTDRLVMRRWHESDRTPFAALNADPETMRFFPQTLDRAARAALEVAFDGIGLDEIWSMTAVVNEPSQAVMRRLGLVEVARFNHPRVSAGHLLQPHVTYHLRRP